MLLDNQGTVTELAGRREIKHKRQSGGGRNHTHCFSLTVVWIQMKHRCAAAALYAGQRQRCDAIWSLKPIVWPHSLHTVSLKRLTCSLVLWTVLLKMLHWTTNSTATSCRQTCFVFMKNEWHSVQLQIFLQCSEYLICTLGIKSFRIIRARPRQVSCLTTDEALSVRVITWEIQNFVDIKSVLLIYLVQVASCEHSRCSHPKQGPL